MTIGSHLPPPVYQSQEEQRLNEIAREMAQIALDTREILKKRTQEDFTFSKNLKESARAQSQIGQGLINAGRDKKEVAVRGLLAEQGCRLITKNDSDAASIMTLVNKILNQYQTYLPLTVVVREKKCIRLTAATVSFLMKVLTQAHSNSVNLTGFINELVPAAYEALISDKAVSEVILSESVQNNETLEKIASDVKAKKSLKVFYWKESTKQLVEFKSITSKSYDTLPEGSPPKAIIAKPLPKKPAAKAQPKTPVLEAK